MILRIFEKWHRLLDEKDPEKSEGGGGSGADPLKELKDQNAALLARLEKLEKGGQKDEPEDLADKANKKKVELDKAQGSQKRLESAIKFDLGAREWAKTNASLLPKSIEGILDAAAKETYESVIQKDAAIKSGIISEFFAIASNFEELTPSQKIALEEFRKLTKNGKEEKALEIYDSIFEPTFETLKKVEKARQLREGGRIPGDAESAYKEKLIKASRKHFMGEK